MDEEKVFCPIIKGDCNPNCAFIDGGVCDLDQMAYNVQSLSTIDIEEKLEEMNKYLYEMSMRLISLDERGIVTYEGD